MTVGIGDIAPDFRLPGTGERDYALSDFRGHSVVLAFYPGDNSPVCTAQLNEYSREIGEFQDLDATVFGISPQSVASHEKFSGKQGFPFPLLADEEKNVGREYGILGPLGFYRRSVFVIDTAGVIRYAHRSATGMTFKKSSELIEALTASRPASS
jgi:thioredoxin-dependent peroxiredoxin